MAGKGGFNVNVGVVDSASAGLDRINKRIAAMNAPAERAGKALAKFGDVTGVSRLSESMGNLGHSALDVFRSVDRISGPLELITSAGSIAGMTALVSRFAALGTRLTQTSYHLDMSASDLSKWETAATLTGVSTESLDKGMSGLSGTLRDFEFHRQTQDQQRFADVMKSLGVDMLDLQGKARPTADVIKDMAGALQKIPDVRTRLRLLDMSGFGSDNYRLVKDGIDGINDSLKKAQDLGGVMSPKMIADANAATRSFNALGTAVQGVGNRLADWVEPPLTHWMDKTAAWIADNKELADSIAKISTVLGALMLLKPAAWLLKLLGVPVGLAAPVAAAAAVASLSGDTMQTPEGDKQYARGLALEAARDRDHANISDPQHILSYAEQWKYRPTWLGGVAKPANPQSWPGSWASPNTKSWSGRWKNGVAAGPQAANDPTITPQGRALLDTIAAPESKGAYDVLNGGQTFSDFSAFPHTAEDRAAGRYQFKEATWKGEAKKLGLTDFSPASQDRAAWDLAQSTYRQQRGRDVGGALSSGDPAQLADVGVALNQVWPSGPGGSQQIEAGSDYGSNLGRNIAAQSGSVHVEIALTGAPPGTTAKVVTKGAVTTSPPRIETAMVGT